MHLLLWLAACADPEPAPSTEGRALALRAEVPEGGPIVRVAIKACAARLDGERAPAGWWAYRLDDTDDTCPVHEFLPGDTTPRTLLPPAVDVPDQAWETLTLSASWYELDVRVLLPDAFLPVTRRLRIALHADGPRLPGDVTLPALGDRWVLGPGNLTADADLIGLDRAAAYSDATWPDGAVASTRGPVAPPLGTATADGLPLVGALPADGIVDLDLTGLWSYAESDDAATWAWPAEGADVTTAPPTLSP